MDETQAIAQIKRGDLTGLETLVRKHQTKAVYAAYLVLQDRQLAEDVVQNTFFRVVERIGQFDETRPFEPWFIRSVVNAALDTARKSNRWISLDAEAEGDAGIQVEWLTDNHPCPQDLVETQELRQAIRSALKRLNADQRAAIVLRYFLDMNEAEMTDELHQPVSTIKWWLHEAKRNLKEILHPFL
jgi:RNA polymerase sigma-70 factor (ECF subfamily)